MKLITVVSRFLKKNHNIIGYKISLISGRPYHNSSLDLALIPQAFLAALAYFHVKPRSSLL